MAKNTVTCISLFALWYLHTIAAVKITSLDVPKNAWDTVKLNCKYDLEDGTLYAAKWYKDNIEFFRCLADGSVQEFPLKDVKIYHTGRSQSGSCFFELTALTPKSGGEYMCEVSLDWPTFQIVTESAHLKIIEPSRIVQPEATTSEVVTLPVEGSKGPRYLSSYVNIFIVLFVIYIY
ncbi:uncharacterized protein [Tenebrio molitor]|jgi:hypothetical protein|uniref:uncharacterized protein n=1 Tax=Tenebrio molitor TaxID=7067 RepID=UPI003624AA20